MNYRKKYIKKRKRIEKKEIEERKGEREILREITEKSVRKRERRWKKEIDRQNVAGLKNWGEGEENKERKTDCVLYDHCISN